MHSPACCCPRANSGMPRNIQLRGSIPFCKVNKQQVSYTTFRSTSHSFSVGFPSLFMKGRHFNTARSQGKLLAGIPILNTGSSKQVRLTNYIQHQLNGLTNGLVMSYLIHEHQKESFMSACQLIQRSRIRRAGHQSIKISLLRGPNAAHLVANLLHELLVFHIAPDLKRRTGLLDSGIDFASTQIHDRA